MGKTELIKTLMVKEQNRLKLKKRLQDKKEKRIEGRKNKTTFPDEKRQKLINQQLLAEKKYLFGNQDFSDLSLASTSMETTQENVSLKCNIPRASTSTPEKNKIETKDPSLSIQTKRLTKFLKMLKEEKQLNNCQKSVQKCVCPMNTSAKGHWTLPITTMKAIKDCILNRRWENLTHFLLILIKLPTFRYQPLIRHVSSTYLTSQNIYNFI